MYTNKPSTSAPKLLGTFSQQQQKQVDSQLLPEQIQSYKPLYYNPKQFKSQHNLQELQQGSALRHAPKCRDFRKTIPKQIPLDKERLYEELRNYKEKYHTFQMENNRLKSRVQMLSEDLAKGKREDGLSHGGQEQGNNNIVSVTFTLKQQIKELNDALEEREEEMQKIKRNVKLTRLQEIETELKAYQDESIRLKQILQQYLRLSVNDSDENDSLQERYLQLIQKYDEIQTQHQEQLKLIQSQQLQIDQLQRSRLEIQNSYQQLINEKTVLRQIIQDKEKELDKVKGSDIYLSRRSGQSGDGQLRIELERKMFESNQFKNENIIKEKKIQELERKLKQLKQEFSDKLNGEIKDKNQFKEKSDKYKQELIELQEKYQQIVFNSRVVQQPTSMLQRRTTFLYQSEETPMNQFNPCLTQPSPSLNNDKPKVVRRTTMKYIQIVNKQDVQQIATVLRYRLRAQNIPSSEIDIYLFSEEMKINQQVSISEMIEQLQKQPFSLDSNESVKFARYLIEPQTEKQILYNINLKNDTNTILHSLQHTIGKYTLLLGEDRIHVHNQIRDEIYANKDKILSLLKQKKQQESSTLPDNHYTRDSFLTALIQTQLDEEQKDFFMQTIYEITNDYNLIDTTVIWNHWPREGDVIINRHNALPNSPHSSKTNSSRVRTVQEPPIVQLCIDAILAYAQANNLSILDMRQIIDEDKSGYVDRQELGSFIKKCNVSIETLQLMQVVDFFDEAGDGRISVSDIGNVLKSAQIRRENDTNKHTHQRKNKDVLIQMVAQQLLQYMQQNNQDLFDIFNMIDQDRQGSISKEEMRKLLRTKVVIPMQKDEFDEFFDAFDETRDGETQYAEFAKIMIPAIEKITGRPMQQVKSFE